MFLLFLFTLGYLNVIDAMQSARQARAELDRLAGRLKLTREMISILETQDTAVTCMQLYANLSQKTPVSLAYYDDLCRWQRRTNALRLCKEVLQQQPEIEANELWNRMGNQLGYSIMSRREFEEMFMRYRRRLPTLIGA